MYSYMSFTYSGYIGSGNLYTHFCDTMRAKFNDGGFFIEPVFDYIVVYFPLGFYPIPYLKSGRIDTGYSRNTWTYEFTTDNSTYGVRIHVSRVVKIKLHEDDKTHGGYQCWIIKSDYGEELKLTVEETLACFQHWQQMTLALAMGTHHNLGKSSTLRGMPKNVFRKIVTDVGKQTLGPSPWRF